MKKFSTSFMYDDMVGQQKLSNFIFTSSPDFLVASISPIDLHLNLDSDKEEVKERISSEWPNQMRIVDENDNPILILIKLKEDL